MPDPVALVEKSLDKTKSNDDSKEKPHEDKEAKKPAGGHDSTPLADVEPGWTVKFTFHRATNLPMADINSMSSDPFVLAKITTSLPTRHKEDPPLEMRSPTIRRNTNPEWNCEWIVANIPSSGFTLRAGVWDEDPADHDDHLGHVHIDIENVTKDFATIKNQPYKIRKRYGSKRAYLIRTVASCFHKAKNMHGELFLSIELLGRTQDSSGGRVYTLGPSWWTMHYSPMLGRLVNHKEPDEEEQSPTSKASNSDGDKSKKSKTQRYNFQANQLQFRGPVPAELYHRYVEFKPFVKGMFTKSGIRGFLLAKALMHQHNRVYNFDQSTQWGRYDGAPSKQVTKDFLEHCHFDKGGRIFTYVITLDALFRFTETGKEFSVDMLSKHTMHSNVNIYIAFSGEFFIRRLKNPRRPPPPDAAEDTSQSHPPSGVDTENASHPPVDIPGGESGTDSPTDPSYYELIIDNDSGTYRPNADLLPVLKGFLADQFPGLHIQTLDCQADAEKMSKWKAQQRDRKKKEGSTVVYLQGGSANSSSASVSSSDEEELDRLADLGEDEGDGGGVGGSRAGDMDRKLRKELKKDAGLRGKDKYERFKRNNPHHQRNAHGPANHAGPGAAAHSEERTDAPDTATGAAADDKQALQSQVDDKQTTDLVDEGKKDHDAMDNQNGITDGERGIA